MFKYAFISKKHDFIRVYTGYRAESWLIIHSIPVYVLKTDTSLLILKEHLIDCFNHSREITKKEEDEEFYLGNKLLKLLKEKSWKSSYNTNTCLVSYRDSEGFKLTFTKFDPKSNSSPIFKQDKLSIQSINEIDVGEILKILDKI